jgi:hypothetical protein
VQAELRAKTGSPHLGPTHMPQNMSQPPTMQRAIMNRHHQARRSTSNIAPKLEPGAVPVTHAHPSMPNNPSPASRPTPPSHHSSPISNSPGFPQQGVMTPPASVESQLQTQRSHQQVKTQLHHGLPMPPSAGGISQPMTAAMKGQGSSGPGSMGGVPAAYYPSPFQNHIEQLGKLTRPLLSNFF